MNPDECDCGSHSTCKPGDATCAGCGKNFCAYHVVTDTKPHSSLDINKKDTDLYCKNCHPMKI